jgi:hypothetical protein
VAGDVDGPGNLVRVEEFFTATQLATAMSQAVYGNNQAANSNAPGSVGLVNFADRTAISATQFSSGVFTVGNAVDTDGPNLRVPYFAGQSAFQEAPSMAGAINVAFPGGPPPTANALPQGAVSLAPGFTFVAPTDSIFAVSGNAPGGQITGIATLNGELWAVSAPDPGANGVAGPGGGLYRVRGANGTNFDSITFNAELDYIQTATDLVGLDFQGLSAGPAFVENGAYSNLLFGITRSGELYAFDTNGILQPVFWDGLTHIPTGLTNVNGLSFSNLDRNLWHATEDFINQPGAAGGLSLGFTNERDIRNLGAAPSANTQSVDSLGFLVGGAQGRMESEYFSLEGYSAADQPTLYFSYFQEGDTTTDAFNVYITRPDGQFDLISGNGPNGNGNSVTFENTGTWRQVRINLGAYAGEPELKLRLEFDTGRDSSIGSINNVGVELRARPGNVLRDGQKFTINAVRDRANSGATQNVTFEFEMGHTVVMPPGSQIMNGDQITIQGPTGTRTFTFVLGGSTGEKDGKKDYVVGDRLYALPYHVCPTVNLYERLHVVEEGKITGCWKNIARDRTIHY